MSSQQTGVYVQDHHYGWLPARIKQVEETTYVLHVYLPDDTHEVRHIPKKLYEHGSLPLQNTNDQSEPIIVSDMCDLPCLHEAAILYNLKMRHEQSCPYTRVGEIVIAMNPFEWINGLYSTEQQNLYTQTYVYNQHRDFDRQILEPHIYEVSSLAYRGLVVNSTHQSILVSGESGAGKTESVKIIMNHLASVNSCQDDSDRMLMDESKVVKKIIDSNPLLEAFGNAKTIRNDNSSRFGKYIQLQFDVEDATIASYHGKQIPSCLLVGSKCETYLLEKSRVVGHDAHERTYHIFYQLLAAGDQVKNDIWEGLMGSTLESFKYIGETNTHVIENMTDAQRWNLTVESLELIGVVGEKFLFLMKAICAVMQLGNLTFEEDPQNDEASIISSDEELGKLSSIIGVGLDYIRQALTFREVHAGKDTYNVPLKPSHAKGVCDAFAKAIYQQCFDWLVSEINGATCAEKNYDDAPNVETYGTIGLLDIFGFESFAINRFEQFCINYANEKLQQKYNFDIFSSVRDEYEYEGIDMPGVNFSDNSEVLHLIEGRMGIISMLNEECLRPHGNSNSFVAKIKTVNKDIDCLQNDPLHKPVEFEIFHYAEKVLYNAESFVKKNMDQIPNDLSKCASLSSNPLIALISKRNVDTRKGKNVPISITSKFRSQLHKLMQQIQNTKTRYVRCIKPNPEKESKKIDLLSSMKQLRCTGVVSAVTMARVSFPNRLTFDAVVDRFSCLNESASINMKQMHSIDDIRGLLRSVVSEYTKHESAFVCGKSRIYFKEGVLEFLEEKRIFKLGKLATLIQKNYRGYRQLTNFNRLKSSVILLQTIARMTRARNKLELVRTSVNTIASFTRRIFAKQELLRRRRNRACVLIQTRFRMITTRRKFERSVLMIITLQKYWRGSLQRPRYRAMVLEAKAEAKMNAKIAALQRKLADAEMKYIKAEKGRIKAEKRALNDSCDEKSLDDSTSNKTLIDESTEMIELLKQENFKLRSQVYLLKSDLNDTKTSLGHLSEQCRWLQDSHEALKKYANEMSQANIALNQKNMDLKKKYSEMKKTAKTSASLYKSKLQKMQEKDRNCAKEIHIMSEKIRQMQLDNITEYSSAQKSNRGGSSKSNKSKNKSQGKKGKIRAKIHGRDSLNSSLHQIKATSHFEDERWGVDSFFEDKHYSPVKDESREYSGRDDLKLPFVPTSSLGRSIISPTNRDGGSRDKRSPVSSLQSVLQGTSPTNAVESESNSRRSSLAQAASFS